MFVMGNAVVIMFVFCMLVVHGPRSTEILNEFSTYGVVSFFN